MNVAAFARIVAWCGLAGCIGISVFAERAIAAEPGKAVIIGINDVYQIEGVDGGRSGGMARVRALRAELEKVAPDLLLLHAGDFLSPSFPGRSYKGAQMIDAMNLMDGNPAEDSFDARMFVAFGNHEFDDTNCNRSGPLDELVTVSEFTWLASNFDFRKCAPLAALASNKRVVVNRVVESGGLKIGLFSVGLAYPAYAQTVLDPIGVACQQIKELRSRGVDAVVALTHLTWEMDRELLGLGDDWKALPKGGRECSDVPDLVIGGHDHKNMGLPSEAPRLFKADADAQSAWVVEIEKAEGGLKISGRLEVLDNKRAVDPLVRRVSGYWLKLNDERYCLRDCVGRERDALKACLSSVDGGRCLAQEFARAVSVVETEEIINRSYETGFGDWLADIVREAGEADVAFINAGSIRINQDLPAGTMITRRHLAQMFPFQNTFVSREVSGADLWRAVSHAVAKRGEGPWAHFSGMAVRLAEAGSAGKVARVLVRRRDGSVLEIGPQNTDRFKVASSSFVLANGDGHGFEVCEGKVFSDCILMLEADPQWPLQGEAAEMTGLVGLKLREAGRKHGLEFRVDRRLCDRGQVDCLIETW
ncbi:MAG: 5'-nucleotidase C-terminal domain-containing protein [Alphaproteobacteria bacterium]|nr:5'-nucleotidase C-terminal domain-containing protein [Alphaproteobacteria bacterium]